MILSMLSLNRFCKSCIGIDAGEIHFTIVASEFGVTIGTETELGMIIEDQLKKPDPSILKFLITYVCNDPLCPSHLE